MRRPELAPALATASALACASAFALACASCSAPASCDVEQFTSGVPALETEEQSGSVRFTTAKESLILRFRASLSDLPELWPNDSMVISDLPLELSFRYEREPFGADGKTEMPRLSVAVAERAGEGFTEQTTSYPGPIPLSVAPRLFKDCAFGSRQCETSLTVIIQRIDGAPFPPIDVNWRANARAQVNACKALGTAPELTLELAEP